MISTILGIGLDVLVAVLFFKNGRHQEPVIKQQQPVSKVNYNSLCNNIDLLSNLRLQLTDIENMIIDIENYDTNELTTININNNNRSCGLMINNKSAILSDLYMQREYLRNNITSLLSSMI